MSVADEGSSPGTWEKLPQLQSLSETMNSNLCKDRQSWMPSSPQDTCSYFPECSKGQYVYSDFRFKACVIRYRFSVTSGSHN